MRLRGIGYWRSAQEPELPDPRDFIDPEWDADERYRVVDYLLGGQRRGAYMGISPCRIRSRSVADARR